MVDAYCLGELLIDFVPTVTGTGLADAPAFTKAAGGAPANVAVGLARLGITSGFLGMVGADPFGGFLKDTMREAGVDVAGLRATDEAHTALAFVALRADGERDFCFFGAPSADKLLRPEDIDIEAVAASRLLHFGSISLSAEPVRAATLHAVNTARAAGAIVSYDPNLRMSFWPNAEAARDGMLAGLAESHVVKISEDELEFLTGSTDLQAARRHLWHDELRLLVVTLGSRGSQYLTPAFAGEVPSIDVECVDTTGAGDGFMAGLLAQILSVPTVLENEARLREACRFANVVGAIATTSRGAIPSLPTWERVMAVLEKGS